jgi:hypothetical protein
MQVKFDMSLESWWKIDEIAVVSNARPNPSGCFLFRERLAWNHDFRQTRPSGSSGLESQFSLARFSIIF